MKICGIVCEYNPFHNGHAYLISRAKELSGCDTVVCVMSGSFVQRGEPAILDRSIRAEHAVRAGADAVLELPAAFALSPAELFAAGAVGILSALPGFCTLAFGCEDGNEEEYLAAAKLLSEESDEFKRTLKGILKGGESLVRARIQALQAVGEARTAALLASPNNILGTEYCRALLARGMRARLFPVKRAGRGHRDGAMGGNFSSATAIRAALCRHDPSVSSNVPPFVLDDLQSVPDLSSYKDIALYALLIAAPDRLKSLPDCGEGLENRLRSLARECTDHDELVGKATNRRYTSSRIRRIAAAAVLGISGKDMFRARDAAPYLRVLALKKERADELLSAFSASAAPLLVRASDFASAVHSDPLLALDERAADIRDLVSHSHSKRSPRFV